MTRMLSSFKARKFSFLLSFLGFVIPVFTQLLTALPAQADCLYEGKTYKTGDTYRSFVCMPDGTWQSQ
jgi:hypothetical protein